MRATALAAHARHYGIKDSKASSDLSERIANDVSARHFTAGGRVKSGAGYTARLRCRCRLASTASGDPTRPNQASAERPVLHAGRWFPLIVTVDHAPAPCATFLQNPHHPYKILYNSTILPPKPVVFVGSALADLRGFPLPARREAGHQIDQVQRGLAPDDWKPMRTVGVGVREIRLRDAIGAFRIIYVATFADAVYVLHCFRKQSARTTRADIDLAARRYRALMMERKR